MKTFLTAVIFFICSRVPAQPFTYFIFFTKGDVMVKKPGQSVRKAIALQSLSLHDSIFLNTDQSVVTIANTSGTRTELKGKGKYRISGIEEREKLQGPGASSKFFSFLYEELLHPKRGFNLHSVAASWGGGSRTREDLVKLPINGLVTSVDSILFTWKHQSKKPEYRFILYDNNSQEIFRCNLRDTQLVIHTRPLKLSEENLYFWTVQPVREDFRNSPRYRFELVSQEEEEKRVDSILEEVPVNENEILYRLEIADQLGRRGFVDKALVYFEQAYSAMKKKN